MHRVGSNLKWRLYVSDKLLLIVGGERALVHERSARDSETLCTLSCNFWLHVSCVSVLSLREMMLRLCGGPPGSPLSSWRAFPRLGLCPTSNGKALLLLGCWLRRVSGGGGDTVPWGSAWDHCPPLPDSPALFLGYGALVLLFWATRIFWNMPSSHFPDIEWQLSPRSLHYALLDSWQKVDWCRTSPGSVVMVPPLSVA